MEEKRFLEADFLPDSSSCHTGRHVPATPAAVEGPMSDSGGMWSSVPLLAGQRREEESRRRSSRDEDVSFWFLFVGKIAGTLAFLIVGLYVSLLHADRIRRWEKTMLKRIAHLGPLYAPAGFLLIYVVVLLLFLPVESLNIAAGFIFCNMPNYGKYAGGLLALILTYGGLLTAGTLVFFAARLAFFQTTRSLLLGCSPFYAALLLAIEEGGCPFVTMLRLSPMTPYTLSNVLFGMSGLPYLYWLVASLGGLPQLVFCVWLGSSLASISDSEYQLSKWAYVLLSLGLLLTAAAVVYFAIILRRAISRVRHRRLNQMSE